MITMHHGSEEQARISDAKQYRRVYVACFTLFLLITTIGRMLPQQWRSWQPEPETRKSIIQETREKASTFAPYVFMDH